SFFLRLKVTLLTATIPPKRLVMFSARMIISVLLFILANSFFRSEYFIGLLRKLPEQALDNRKLEAQILQVWINLFATLNRNDFKVVILMLGFFRTFTTDEEPGVVVNGLVVFPPVGRPFNRHELGVLFNGLSNVS